MNRKEKLSHDENNADGSTRVESLKIHANASEEDIETARLRAYDRNFREAYQCGLSDRIAPLPPRLEEVEREYEANGTLLAELHRRSQLEKFNRINND